MNMGVGIIICGIIELVVVAVFLLVMALIDDILCRLSPKHKKNYEKRKVAYEEKQKEFKSWKK